MISSECKKNRHRNRHKQSIHKQNKTIGLNAAPDYMYNINTHTHTHTQVMVQHHKKNIFNDYNALFHCNYSAECNTRSCCRCVLFGKV